MKKAMIAAASLALLAACSSLPESVTGPFAHSSQGATASDGIDQASSKATSPYPAVTDRGLF
jgi:starvation-inducible outer membrane lipoprotein